MHTITKLQKACDKAGVELKDCGNGHYQIKGALLVNYYPETAKKTTYISGTTEALNGIDIDTAVEMSLKVPDRIQKKAKRKSSYKRHKKTMLRKKDECHWCEKKLTIETATIDHVIPLSIGGLDNSNNRVLACEPCNQKRGNKMPEILNHNKEK